MVTLTIHHGRRLLAGLCAALAAALAASVAALALTPLDAGTPGAASVESPVADNNAVEPAARPLKDYEIVWKRNLLAPLYDAAPVVAVKAPAPPPKLPVTLLGTVVEPGHTYGMFRDKDGRTKFVRVGQSIDGAEVKTITGDGATVLFAGREITLKAEKTTAEKKDGR